ncbi:hypothetical protein OG535_01840 [Kitasatospora sp. NBC_00085]|uniref:hypothetical protein n=1 Tax=unclassified Kitasatospora TaxID=2633591 RepID=UPI002F9176FB
MDERIAAWIRFARAHHFSRMVISVAVLSAVNLLFGAIYLAFPFADHAVDSPIPFRKEMPLAFASVAAASLDSAMRSLEFSGSSSFRRLQVTWLAGSLAVVAVVVAVEELATGLDGALVSLRSMAIWGGFAIASGRIFGWRLSWILPLLTIFPLTYWEIDDLGRRRWWDWPGQPVSSLSCWVMAGISFLIAVGLIYLTPWRASRMRALFLARVSNY